MPKRFRYRMDAQGVSTWIEESPQGLIARGHASVVLADGKRGTVSVKQPLQSLPDSIGVRWVGQEQGAFLIQFCRRVVSRAQACLLGGGIEALRASEQARSVRLTGF